MSDLGWRADGIERAKAAGGIELERYTRPGFTGGPAVRRTSDGGYCSGFTADLDPQWYGDEDEDGRRK